MADVPREQASEVGLSRAVWRVAGVVIIGMFMSILDTTIVNVALETLSRELNSPLSTIQWVSSGYLLSLAIVIPLAGWMTERFGAKRVWMISIAVFGATSALCGLAWSDGSLIFFRVLQGFGGGMIVPVGMSLLAQTGGPQHVGRVMSVVGVPLLLGPILGPVIGGAIVSSVSWRWIFFVNVPVAALALVLAARRLSPDAGRADAGRLDWRGFLLLAPGLVGIVFGLSETETQGGFSHPLALGPIVAGVALVAAFVLYSYRATRRRYGGIRPLIDVRLFSSRSFSAATTTTFFVAAALFGAFLLLPLYYQVARGESPLIAGLLIAPQGLGAALALPFAGRLTDRIGGGRVALFGTTVAALATIPFAMVGAHTPYVLLGVIQFVRGIGIGSAMMPAMASAFAVLGSAQVPRAAGALNAIQRVGGAVGTALMAVVLEHQLNIARAGSAGDVANAFGQAFRWTFALSVLAVVAAAILTLAQRRERDPGARQPDGTAASVVGASA